MQGGCFCGAVRYRIDGDPDRVTHCHCEHCRRTGGAPFLTWIEVEASRFALVGGTPSRYTSRPGVTRSCCSRCGTQLTYQHADEPDVVDITACSLDEPDAIAPEDHVWCERMLPWLKLADGLPRYRRSRHDS